MRWLRVTAVWVLLMAAEVVHGVARTLFLAPAVGDFRARQLAVFSGSLLILLITTLTIRWLQPTATRLLMLIGVVWVALTLAFEIGLGRLLGYSWNRIGSDYNPLHGGLMPIGLGVMAMSPWMAWRLRRLPAPWNPHDPDADGTGGGSASCRVCGPVRDPACPGFVSRCGAGRPRPHRRRATSMTLLNGSGTDGVEILRGELPDCCKHPEWAESGSSGTGAVIGSRDGVSERGRNDTA
jgi:hypothetical protein